MAQILRDQKVRKGRPSAESHVVVNHSPKNSEQATLRTIKRRNKVIAMLNDLRGKLGVDDAVVRRADEIYKLAIAKNMVRGRSIEALAASAFYAACRETGAQVTLKDIHQTCSITRKDLSRCYRFILRELDIRMPVVESATCIERIAADAGVPEKIKDDAVKILQDVSTSRLSAGKDPMGLAAAALYLACSQHKVRKTQKAIAVAADVTEVTIRNRYKGLRDALYTQS